MYSRKVIFITYCNKNTIKARLFNVIKSLKICLEVIYLKDNKNIYSLGCESIKEKQFEELLEVDLIDIEKFLDSYIVNKVEEEKIDLTIDVLKDYLCLNIGK